MSTFRYVARRIVNGIALLAGVLVLSFFLIHAAPGDPALVIVGEMGGATEQVLAEIRAAHGLDRPIAEQLLHYLGNALRGDLGQSIFFGQPVAGLVGERVVPTLLLVLSGTILAAVIGLAMGIFAARKPHGPSSVLITVIATIGYTVPVFCTGILLISLFASVVPLFPAQGMSDVRFSGGRVAYAMDVLHHLVLPATTLAIVLLAQYARITRTSMIGELAEDYVRVARARGISEQRIVFRHALRNALVPIVTIAGSQFGTLMSGALLVETVFNWPGIGSLAYDSILRRDFPTVLGVLFFSASIVLVANLVVDLFYRLIDPRMRVGAGTQ